MQSPNPFPTSGMLEGFRLHLETGENSGFAPFVPWVDAPVEFDAVACPDEMHFRGSEPKLRAMVRLTLYSDGWEHLRQLHSLAAAEERAKSKIPVLWLGGGGQLQSLAVRECSYRMHFPLFRALWFFRWNVLLWSQIVLLFSSISLASLAPSR